MASSLSTGQRNEELLEADQQKEPPLRQWRWRRPGSHGLHKLSQGANRLGG